jgi:GxxExxY protein
MLYAQRPMPYAKGVPPKKGELITNQDLTPIPVVIENKTVDKIAPIHEAQLLTYLKLTNLKLGFLLNWNVPLMKDGIKRMVNSLNR